MNTYIQLNDRDNTIIALKPIPKESRIKIKDTLIKVQDDIPQAHKIALEDIKKGEHVIKYGMPIGKATHNIMAGQHVHTHNVATELSDITEYQYVQQFEKISVKSKKEKIKIYRRKNGEIGIRNELWIVPTVGCVNATANQIIEAFKKSYDLSHIDGVYAFPHPYGCSQMGDDHENTKKVLQGLVKHPNAGGVLVLGLGCENNQIQAFKETLGSYDEDRVAFLNSQDVKDEIQEGVKILTSLYNQMKEDQREEGSISELKIGLECGGSDGLSGITANPLLGFFSDYMVAHGGTTVLTEVPEMFGAETILMRRAKDEAIYHKIVEMVNGFKKYYKDHGQTIYENPSPGNKKGGITTLEDKSLGCTQKAGHSKVVDVLKYGEPLKEKGVNLLTAPGNDLVATTALGVSGCHLVLFTTGRGTPFGGFIPTVKISSNNELAEKKENWIDFNAGQLVDGKRMELLLKEFIHLVVETVNGKKTRNETNNFREIAIFKSGVIL
ncbi:MAG: altronate dehydratase family protein [Clostridia bacterium]|nr:altronate dehydratase family protein [Clostridia bacterium]